MPAPIAARIQQPMELNTTPLEPNIITILTRIQPQAIANQIASSILRNTGITLRNRGITRLENRININNPLAASSGIYVRPVPIHLMPNPYFGLQPLELPDR